MLGHDLWLAAGGFFCHGGELLFGLLELERLHAENARTSVLSVRKMPQGRRFPDSGSELAERSSVPRFNRVIVQILGTDPAVPLVLSGENRDALRQGC